MLADAPPSALLAPAPLPIVLADALSPAIPTLVPYPSVLADAAPSAFLAPAPNGSFAERAGVLADARPAAVVEVWPLLRLEGLV